MRKSVPFIGEEMIVRGDDDKNIASNKAHIDDVLCNDGDPSSWDDASLSGSSPPSQKTRGFAAISKAGSGNPRLQPAVRAQKNRHLEWIPVNNGHCLRINISGCTDIQLLDEWKKLLQETADNSITQFEFNLAQMPELSLTGLGMLLYFKDQKCSRRQDIKLCHCNGRIKELLQWTGMEKHFVIQGSLATEEK